MPDNETSRDALGEAMRAFVTGAEAASPVRRGDPPTRRATAPNGTAGGVPAEPPLETRPAVLAETPGTTAPAAMPGDTPGTAALTPRERAALLESIITYARERVAAPRRRDNETAVLARRAGVIYGLITMLIVLTSAVGVAAVALLFLLLRS